MKNKYIITSGVDSSVDVELMLDHNELKLISYVLKKLDEEGLKQGYCPYFYIKDENGKFLYKG